MIASLPANYAGGAPTYSMFGAFFPAWLFCAVVGLVACFLLRGGMIAIRLHDAIPLKLFVYAAFAIVVALCLRLILFGEW